MEVISINGRDRQSGHTVNTTGNTYDVMESLDADEVLHTVAAMPNNENVLKTFLAVARQKDYEMAVHHIASLEPGGEWEMALTDLSICAESIEKSEEDIQAEFWDYAKDEPDGPAILAAAQSELQLMHMIR